MAEDEMVGWHHRLNGHELFFFFFFNGHELEQTPGDGAVQGGHKESDTT